MKRSWLFCLLFFVFLAFQQSASGSSFPFHNYISFDSLVNSGKTVLEIDHNYDLRIKTKKVLCSKEIKYNSKTLYIGPKSLFLEEGQVIILPDDCILLSDDCSRKLGAGFYEAPRGIRCFVASIKRGNYNCPITRKIQLRPDIVLSFTTGSLHNAIIDMSGGIIEAPSKRIFVNSFIINIGNSNLKGKWFFQDKQFIKSVDLERLSEHVVDFDNLHLYSFEDIHVTNAMWKNFSLTAPTINIGNRKEIISGIPISKSDNKDSKQIETTMDLSSYEGKIVLLSFGEHVHYDWREEKGKPTLFRGVTSILKKTNEQGFQIEDTVEAFRSTYKYTSSDYNEYTIKSLGYIYEPCRVIIDNCNFYSTKRQSPGFMYVNAGKDIVIRNSNWIASAEGTPSLLGVVNSVNGVVENCSYTGAFFEGTTTSYGLQLFGSTRIKVTNCRFSRNRRGLDFSGNVCQSRYCSVVNCKVVGDIIKDVGSGIGSHSTSYRNSYINNTIEGSSNCIGIQTRGEYELIEGNVFNLSFSAAAITCVENTIIRDNVCNKQSKTFVWIESSSIANNQILVVNNRFFGGYLVRGQKKLSCRVSIRDNIFDYTAPTSSLAPIGDEVHVEATGNLLNKGKDKASLFFKYNPTLLQPKAEGISNGDIVDFVVDNDGKILIK